MHHINNIDANIANLISSLPTVKKILIILKLMKVAVKFLGGGGKGGGGL
jgi:hypothetical protein